MSSSSRDQETLVSQQQSYHNYRNTTYNCLSSAVFTILLTIYWVLTTTVIASHNVSSDYVIPCSVAIVGILCPGWGLCIYDLFAKFNCCGDDDKLINYGKVRMFIECIAGLSGIASFSLNLLFSYKFGHQSLMHSSLSSTWRAYGGPEANAICVSLFPFFFFSMSRTQPVSIALLSWFVGLGAIIAATSTSILPNAGFYVGIHLFLGWAIYDRDVRDRRSYAVPDEAKKVVPVPTETIVEQEPGPLTAAQSYSVLNSIFEDLLNPLQAADTGFETLESLFAKVLSQDLHTLALAKLRNIAAVQSSGPGSNAQVAVPSSVILHGELMASTIPTSAWDNAVPDETSSVNSSGINPSVSNPIGLVVPIVSPLMAQNALSATVPTLVPAASNSGVVLPSKSSENPMEPAQTTETNVVTTNPEVLSPATIAVLKSLTSLLASQRAFCMDLLQSMKASVGFAGLLVCNLRDTAAGLAGMDLVPSYEYFNMAESIISIVNCMSDLQSTIKVAVSSIHDACSLVYSDKRWFESNLFSLLANAVQMSLHHGIEVFPVELYVSKQDLHSRTVDAVIPMLVIELYDNSTDISPSDLHDILQPPFSRSNAPQGNAKKDNFRPDVRITPYGFELFALHQRVRALGGQFGAKRRNDHISGLIFWFAIPFTKQNAGNSKSNKRGLFTPNVSSNFGQDWQSIINNEDGILDGDATNSNDGEKSDVPTMLQTHNRSNRYGNQQKLSWLVADDSISLLKIFSHSLTKLGHKVDTAVNGSLALAMMMHQEYDVVVLDINMPLIDGYEVTTLFRQQEACTLRLNWPYPSQEVSRNRRQIMIGISADSNVEQTKRKALASGLDAFIAKPCSVQRLVKLAAELRSSNAIAGKSSFASTSQTTRSTSSRPTENSSVTRSTSAIAATIAAISPPVPNVGQFNSVVPLEVGTYIA